MSFHYAVNLQDLDDSITAMAGFDARIEQHLAALDRTMGTLHGHWTGDAATEQADAHRRWTEGAAGMRAALKEMHAAARIAHTNYTNAADTNVAMWRQVRG